MAFCLFTEMPNDRYVHKKYLCCACMPLHTLHTYRHSYECQMNPRQISCLSNIGPKELESVLFVHCLPFSRSLALHTQNSFLFWPWLASHVQSIYIWDSVRWIKFALLSAIWIFQNEKNRETHTHRESSGNDCRRYVCTAFVINRIGPHKNCVGLTRLASLAHQSLQNSVTNRTKSQSTLFRQNDKFYMKWAEVVKQFNTMLRYSFCAIVLGFFH